MTNTIYTPKVFKHKKTGKEYIAKYIGIGGVWFTTTNEKNPVFFSNEEIATIFR